MFSAWIRASTSAGRRPVTGGSSVGTMNPVSAFMIGRAGGAWRRTPRSFPLSRVRIARGSGPRNLGPRAGRPEQPVDRQPEPARLDDRLGAVVDVERPQDRRDMDLDGALGEVQAPADQLVRQPLEDEAEDLRLAVGESDLARRDLARRAGTL